MERPHVQRSDSWDHETWERRLLAFAVSLGPRLFAARKVMPAPVSILYWLFLIAGPALTYSYFLSGETYAVAVLAGLAGGCVLLKAAKLRPAEVPEPLPPVAARDLFQWDARAFGKTLIAVLGAILVLGGLLFHWDMERIIEFLVLSTLNALWPLLIMACRATRGPWRTFFLWLIPLVVFATAYPIGGAMAGFSSATILLATIPVGVASGCTLITFGKIRPKLVAARVQSPSASLS